MCIMQNIIFEIEISTFLGVLKSRYPLWEKDMILISHAHRIFVSRMCWILRKILEFLFAIIAYMLHTAKKLEVRSSS